jgi:hypothetical protein
MGLVRTGIAVVVAVSALLAAAMSYASSAAVGPIYKRTLMKQCLIKRHVSFGYTSGPYPGDALLGTKRDVQVTGSVIFNPFALQKGMVVIGLGQLVFTRSPSSARADLPNLKRRFQAVHYESLLKGNVVVMWQVGNPSLLPRPAVLACFRASRVA